ncbi:MAG: redoxin domain-containing protein [Thermoplasmata archaeon]|nr:redoxin domain-containing protein [Thermoplasmata archaeon]
MIDVGTLAPEFSGTAADGSRFTLSSTRGRAVVLFFYPKANSAGCSVEARGFSEHFEELQQHGVSVVGVSVDDVAAQARFAKHCSIPFPLIADLDKAIARKYGVLGFLGLARRITFFIDAEGRVTEVVSGVLPTPHFRAALSRFVRPPP